MAAPRTAALTRLCALLAIPGTLLALALLLGAGVLRQGDPALVALGAGLLVLLPAMGLGALVPDRGLGLTLGLLLWPPVLLAGMPLYFPAERGDALASGLAVMALPLGLTPPHALARRLDAALPAPRPVRPPAVRAEPLAQASPGASPTPPAARSDDAGEVALLLPYEGRGRSMIVPVVVEGPAGEAEVRMLFDTGATLTTLDPATLARIGVRVPPDAPEVIVRTAAGERSARLVVIERLWLAGVEIEGLTVSVCEACAEGETRGLLGLNVSGLFRTTVDHAREELGLEPRPPPWDRHLDVAPWLTLDATATRWEDGRVEVELRAENGADRAILDAEVAVDCAGSWQILLPRVEARAKTSRTVALPVGTVCQEFRIGLQRARW